MKKASMAVIGLILVVVMGVFLGCKPKDETPPEVTIRVEPTSNYESEIDGDVIKGVVKVIATATDDVGVDTVRFFVNDVQVGPHYTEPTGEGENEYVYTWQTQELVHDSTDNNLLYTVSAKAYDASRNEGISNTLSFYVQIINDAPNSAELLRPTHNDTLQQVSVILKWQGSDSDRYPTQELTYEVYFGEGSAGNIKLVNQTTNGTAPDTGNWGTLQWEERDPPYLVPHTHYYWMVLTIDPYGLLSYSDTFHFERGANRAPYFPVVSSPPDSSNPLIDFPAGGELKLLWTPQDPDGDVMTHTLYFASEDEVDTGTVFVSDLGPPEADSLDDPNHTVDVSRGVKYYWRPISTDYWGATPPIAPEDSVKAWSFTVAD